MESEKKTKTWFITGASKGMGLALVKLLLAKGHAVAATSRNKQAMSRQIHGYTETFLPLEMDLTAEESVQNAIQQTVETFGRLDVVVNNAGFAYVGSLEEMTDQEFRYALDVNLFGTVNVIRAAMPYLRQQRSGHIINIASAGGYVAVANLGSYAASKFAMVGLTESLAAEIKPLGVYATVVLPGSFRTQFLEDGSLTYVKTPIAEYGSEKTLDGMSKRAGTQPGDPDKLVAQLVRLADYQTPPVHLILGPDSYRMIMEKRDRDLAEFEAYKETTMSTNLD
ncbi:SDR family NAD(P)-dependent oxidoreductase [Spirosoma aerolatum]|uniref:SDR family NAD(P)-dependent oxidoreductase n=1 Tax=Spirosoma aerolatum TaxID=1211326 RepID=UPI0009AE20D3|nr:SDR family NAD(P)-dependent oxidoreductase [Spirosoma aerolatum]